MVPALRAYSLDLGTTGILAWVMARRYKWVQCLSIRKYVIVLEDEAHPGK